MQQAVMAVTAIAGTIHQPMVLTSSEKPTTQPHAIAQYMMIALFISLSFYLSINPQ